jgi:hypothetical protein
MFALCLRDSEDNLNGDCAKLHLFSDSSLIVTFCHKISNKKNHVRVNNCSRRSSLCQEKIFITCKNKYKIGTLPVIHDIYLTYKVSETYYLINFFQTLSCEIAWPYLFYLPFLAYIKSWVWLLRLLQQLYNMSEDLFNLNLIFIYNDHSIAGTMILFNHIISHKMNNYVINA